MAAASLCGDARRPKAAGREPGQRPGIERAMKPLVHEAMRFARQVHKDEKRKYTGESYSGHLAEVAGIVGSVTDDPEALATAWLHDAVEHRDIHLRVIAQRFGARVAEGVKALSDTKAGNQEANQAASRKRLHEAAPWIQNIKVADIISNTAAIALHDPAQAPKYLAEKRDMLAALDQADAWLVEIAQAQTNILAKVR